jgi:ribonuclease HI/exonuclease III
MAVHKNITTCHWNARGLREKKLVFEDFLFNNDIDICGISETKFKGFNNQIFSQYNYLHESDMQGRGGVALFSKRNICYKQISINLGTNDPQVIAAEYKLKDEIIIAVCLYNHPDKPLTSQCLQNIYDQIPANQNVIIMGDFNAHHSLWGGNNDSPKGKNIVEFVQENNLVIINDGSCTRIGNITQNNTAIDLTMVSSPLALVSDWHIYEDLMGSDHLPSITIIINQHDTHKNSDFIIDNRRNFKKANWTKYQEEVDIELNNFELTGNISEDYEKFFGKVQMAAEKNIPRMKEYTTISHPHHNWWNEACDTSTLKRKEATSTLYKNIDIQTLSNSNRLTAIAVKTTKKAKKDGWKSFSCSLNRSSNIGYVFNMAKRYRLGTNKLAREENNNPLNIEEYASFICPDYTPSICESKIHEQENIILGEKHPMHEDFSINEIALILSSIKDSESATGQDEISYSMIINLSLKAKSILLDLFNLIWKSGGIPISWKKVSIIPLLKPNKPKGEIKSYRPVALSSCVLKLFEHLIKNRLITYLESNILIPNLITGFRKGKSTADNIIHLITDIQLAWSSNNSVIAACYDIQGAFDNVNIPLLMQKCEKLGIPNSIIKILKNILTERITQIKYGKETSQERIAFLGLPQGSVLSPILFVIYTIDLFGLFPRNIIIIMYADDLLIYIICRDLVTGMKIMESTNEILINWLTNSHLQLCSAKSSFLIFSKLKSKNLIKHMKFGTENIARVQHTTVLGIVIDENLTWTRHIEKLHNACHKALNIIKATCKVRWGADPSTALLLYKSLIRSKIEYCSFIFANASDTTWKKIEGIQNTAMRLITGAFKSSPIAALQIEASLPPLIIRSQFSADKYLIKCVAFKFRSLLSRLYILKRHVDTPTPYYITHNPPQLIISLHKYSHLIPLIRKDEVIPCYKIPIETVASSISIDYAPVAQVDRDIPHLSSSIASEYLAKYQNTSKIYTDGSKTQEGVGAAFYDEDNDICEKFSLPNSCSIFTAEALAISRALSYIFNTDKTNFVILSDSKSVLQALQGNIHKAKSNWILFQVKEKIKLLKENNKNISLCWIPAHCNIKGNEKADKAAKEGITSGLDPGIKIPYTDITNIAKENMIKQWKDSWEKLRTQNQQRRLLLDQEEESWYDKIQPNFPTNPLIPWFSGNGRSRDFYTLITRLRIGHNSCPSHLYRLGMITDKSCQCGHHTMNPSHMFFQCPLVADHRAQLILSLENLGFRKSVDNYQFLIQLLNSKSLLCYDLLFQFAKATNMPI